MARLVMEDDLIRKVKQIITVDGSTDNNLWCSSISTSAGLGSTQATVLVPFAIADEIGERYADKKIVVKAGITSASKTVFVGFISGKSEDISDTADGVSLTAYTAGHYLLHQGIGEDMNHWQYKYPLFDDLTGTPTGWTPAQVLLDIFARLPEEWTDEIALGDVKVITEDFDLPVQNYEFSLSSYKDAIESIISSLGDVAIRERFKDNKLLIDIFRISSADAPVTTVQVAEFDDGTNANVASYTPNVTTDEVINRVIAFGRDKEFMVTCKSVVAGLTDQSEPINSETGQYDTALQKDWDSALEPMVLKDPKLASSDRVNRSLTIKGDSAPGTGGTTFQCEVGIDLIPNKCILVHPSSGERMLVTAFTAKVPADPEADPPTEAVNASVTVQRLYQMPEGSTAGDLELNKQLTIEVPGITNVFRRYRLPACLIRRPKKEFLSDLPVIDPSTQDRVEAQLFIYKSNLDIDDADTTKRTGSVSKTPSLLKGGNKDFDKYRIHLEKPALVPVAVQKTIVNGRNAVKATYQETVVGVTFAYIDNVYPFGWDTAVVESTLNLPWAKHTSRVKLDEFLYWQATNTGYPVIDADGNEQVFGMTFISPRTDVVSTGLVVLRNDLPYLRRAAERHLSERNRRHVSGSVKIPWLDLGYALGNRLEVQGLERQPEELLTITQVSYDMDPGGNQETSITVDNVKPPTRKRFNTQFKKAM